jgi:phenylpropionate dioxygenase-like ring-hydroxylating dioxygenase large terminal subunit
MDYNVSQGFVVYPDAAPGTPDAKAPFLDHGTGPIDKTRYYSKEEADLEWDKMWTKSWQFAGITHDIPEVGDYFKIDIGRESFIIIRNAAGDDGVVAYYNVCPHRGNRIAHSDFGSIGEGGCFRCDFHGWQFDADGKNVGIKDEELFRPEVIAHRPGLKPVRTGVWNSLVFISMAPDGISLLEHLDVLPEHMKDFPIDKFRVISDMEVCWDANWKTALDAFVEFYHADDVHPEVLGFSETLECQYDLYGNGLSRMIIPNGYVTSRFEDRDTVNDLLKMFVKFYGGNPDKYTHLKGFEYWKAFADTKREWGKRHGYDHFDKFNDRRIVDDWNYYVFPNITINFFIEAILIQVFRPHPTDPEKSMYRVISMNLPVGGTNECVADVASIGPEATSAPGWDGAIRPEIRHPTDVADFGAVLAQDARRVPEVQKGLRSGAFDGYLLSESENRIRHYLAEIDKYIGRR